MASLKRRIVASLTTSLARLPRLRRVVRSLLMQRPALQKIYIFVKVPKARVAGSTSCVPGWLSWRPRISVVCTSVPQAGMTTEALVAAPHVFALLPRETSPGSMVLFCDDSHRYGPGLLAHLVSGTDVFVGAAVAARGYTFGKHGGPIPLLGLGFLVYRSFLDSGLRDFMVDACLERLDMAMAAHLANKGVATKVLGDSFGTAHLPGRPPARSRETTQTCRAQLLDAWPMLWASKFPERCALYVSLLQETDPFLLEMTVRYAALQVRKPDEVVLFAMNDNLLQRPVRPRPNHRLAAAEIELRGSVGTGTVAIRTPAGELLDDLPLHELLAGMRDRTSLVVRMFSEFGEPRSFTLAVVSVYPCPEGSCSVVPSMFKAFDRELDPNTVLFFASAERLASERVVAENLECVSACYPHCSRHSWCGQSTTRQDGAIYDLTLRRVAGYSDQTDAR